MCDISRREEVRTCRKEKRRRTLQGRGEKGRGKTTHTVECLEGVRKGYEARIEPVKPSQEAGRRRM